MVKITTDYEGMTVPQLREKAKALGITGRWDMTKVQLIEAIKSATNKSEEKVAEEAKEEANDNDVVGTIREYDKERRLQFVENVSIGSIVAFRCFNGKVKSAKVIAKDKDKRTLEVETNYNKKYSVDFEDVIWVRAGSRWPKGILQLLKSKVAI